MWNKDDIFSIKFDWNKIDMSSQEIKVLPTLNSDSHSFKVVIASIELSQLDPLILPLLSRTNPLIFWHRP